MRGPERPEWTWRGPDMAWSACVPLHPAGPGGGVHTDQASAEHRSQGW